MKSFFMKIKEKMRGSQEEEYSVPEDTEEGYVEISSEGDQAQGKVTVRSFVLDDFADVKPVLDSLRDGYTIALVNIKPLKDRDLVELKRAVSKIKKTCDALEGDIAGFGEDWVCVTPSFAEIYREQKTRAAPGPSHATEIREDEF
ncbi:cell division protein SepF [Candidatus Woesearchaeota archaeon]|nr:cell division protein SepF [Candidatus Woesearchaeota archaeon]